jgi:hypothetical protein
MPQNQDSQDYVTCSMFTKSISENPITIAEFQNGNC